MATIRNNDMLVQGQVFTTYGSYVKDTQVAIPLSLRTPQEVWYWIVKYCLFHYPDNVVYFPQMPHMSEPHIFNPLDDQVQSLSLV